LIGFLDKFSSDTLRV